ncbi:hypothetical protein HGRIS_008738 [Hohenbuehelia grisea]|uniref:Glycosyltransferase n=1 Tax=Hohenbuehelia grisea TaxID=104357 RepID=A0ABR3J961_9AGAR
MKLLLFTLSEYGQANTVLALAEELATRPEVQAIHICSFPALCERVNTLPGSIQLHPLDGPTCMEAAAARGFTAESLPHQPTLKSTDVFRTFDMLLHVYGDETYLALIDQCEMLLKMLEPDLVVVDMMCHFAADACRLLNRRYIINSPVNTLDIVRMSQPWLKGLWYYPAVFSGIPYPVPLTLFISNIAISLMMIIIFMSNPGMRALPEFRAKSGLKGRHPMRFDPNIDTICPAIEETDYPLVCPPNLHRFGPITLNAAPLYQSDPELKTWLDRRKTVVIGLGTHTIYSKDMINAFLHGLLDYLPAEMQVLWKVGKRDWSDEEIGAVGLDSERFRIVRWIISEPIAVMEHPNVVAYVHHGGANSFFECCLAGVPQIITAMWGDLYDNACKAEYRGIGVFGNRSVAPRVDAMEFGQALTRVVGPGPDATQMKENAMRISQLCRKAGGKKVAVDFILSMAAKGKQYIHQT